VRSPGSGAGEEGGAVGRRGPELAGTLTRPGGGGGGGEEEEALEQSGL
jgi:hypothetical protein